MSGPATGEPEGIGDRVFPASHKDKVQLEDYELRFFEHLIAEYEACCAETGRHDGVCNSAKEIICRFRHRKESVTMGDLYELESEILAIQSPAQLRERAPGLFAKYCETQGRNGAVAQAMALPSLDNLGDPNAVELLRARLQQYLRALHWGYAFGPVREKRRVGLIIHAMWLAIVASAVWAIVLALISAYNGPPLVAVLSTVVYAGLMGGTVSATRRLGRIPCDGDPLTSIHALKNSWYIMYFSPMIGAIFAVVLMLVFLSGVLTGKIFPGFSVIDVRGLAAGSWVFTRQFLPTSPTDYALLFLWSFIAGFAEQLVPDTLDRLVSRANALQSTPAQEQQIQNPAQVQVSQGGKLGAEPNRTELPAPSAVGGLRQSLASSVGPAPQGTPLAQNAAPPASAEQASGGRQANSEPTAPMPEKQEEPVHA